jgi:anti-sigma regulatory factor (Ser/Thr protein kinase)
MTSESRPSRWAWIRCCSLALPPRLLLTRRCRPAVLTAVSLLMLSSGWLVSGRVELAVADRQEPWPSARSGMHPAVEVVSIAGISGVVHGIRCLVAAPVRSSWADYWAGGAEVLAYRDELSQARGFAASWGRRAGLPPDRVGDLVIVVGELTANTLAHTGGPGVLRLWVSGGDVVCQVDDGGQITDPQAGMRRPDPAADGGRRGLWVVRQLCDRVEISSGPEGSTVRGHLRFDLGPADGGGGSHPPPE